MKSKIALFFTILFVGIIITPTVVSLVDKNQDLTIFLELTEEEENKNQKAIKALEPAVDALKEGTSIAISPEGTRSKDGILGKFKKGAFHIAMQAGVPLIPIIIKNFGDDMRGSQT